MCSHVPANTYGLLPVESHPLTHLHNYILAEIAVKTIGNWQDAMVRAYDSCLCFFIVFTFYLSGYSDLDLLLPPNNPIPKPSQYAQCQLSATINFMCSREFKMHRNWYVFLFSLAIPSNPFFKVDVSALNLGMIAAYYNIS